MSAPSLTPTPVTPPAETEPRSAEPTQPTGAAGAAAVDCFDQTVSFPELVWAHFRRQNELLQTGGLEAAGEGEYRRRLKLFKQQQGELLNAYWCRYEASGAALTEQTRRERWRPWRTEPILRLHTATEWRTHEVPDVADLLHTCETLAIKVGEVLRGTSERIALQWILAVASRLLGAIDQEKEEPPPSSSTLNTVVKRQRAELREVERYYNRAGQKAARLVYFGGMMRGVMLLVLFGGLAVLVLWPAHALHAHQERTQDLFAACAMGALGAVVSVMSRMATAGRFRLDHEVGRKQLRRLGSFRPFIGAVFALVIYFALKSNLLQLGNLTGTNQADKTLYFYATIAFLAGFSERWAKVLLDGAVGANDDAPDNAPNVTSTKHLEASDATPT
jgi:hypothetical protein